MSQILDGFGLSRPSKEDGVNALQGVFKGDRERALRVWGRACADVDVPAALDELSGPQFIKVATRLARNSGVIGVVGNSLWVRAQTWELLALRAKAQAGARA